MGNRPRYTYSIAIGANCFDPFPFRFLVILLEGEGAVVIVVDLDVDDVFLIGVDDLGIGAVLLPDQVHVLPGSLRIHVHVVLGEVDGRKDHVAVRVVHDRLQELSLVFRFRIIFVQLKGILARLQVVHLLHLPGLEVDLPLGLVNVIIGQFKGIGGIGGDLEGAVAVVLHGDRHGVLRAVIGVAVLAGIHLPHQVMEGLPRVVLVIHQGAELVFRLGSDHAGGSVLRFLAGRGVIGRADHGIVIRRAFVFIHQLKGELAGLHGMAGEDLVAPDLHRALGRVGIGEGGGRLQARADGALAVLDHRAAGLVHGDGGVPALPVFLHHLVAQAGGQQLHHQALAALELEGLAVGDGPRFHGRLLQRFLPGIGIGQHVVDGIGVAAHRVLPFALVVQGVQVQGEVKGLFLGNVRGLQDVLLHGQVAVGNVEVIEGLGMQPVQIQGAKGGNLIPLGQGGRIDEGGDEVIHVILFHLVDILKSAALIPVQPAEIIRPVAVRVRLHRFAGDLGAHAVAAGAEQVHLKGRGQAGLGLLLQLRTVGHQPFLFAAEVHLFVFVFIPDHEHALVVDGAGAFVAGDLVPEGIQVTVAVFIHRGDLEEDLLPDFLFHGAAVAVVHLHGLGGDGHGDGLAGDLADHGLVILAGHRHLAHHGHHDGIGTDVIVVAVVVPVFLHALDFRHDPHPRIVVADHGEVGGHDRSVLVGLAGDQARIVVRVHVVARIDGGRPVDIFKGGGLVRLVRVSTLGVPLGLVPVVVRRGHVQISGYALLGAQDEQPAVRGAAGVDGDGRHVQPLGHVPLAVHHVRRVHPGPGGRIAQHVMARGVLKDHAFVDAAVLGLGKLQPGDRAVIDHRRAALLDELGDVHLVEMAAPLAVALPVALPVELALHVLPVGPLACVIVRLAGARDQIILDGIIEDHVPGIGLRAGGDAQAVGILLPLVHVHLGQSVQTGGPDAVQVALDGFDVLGVRVHVHVGRNGGAGVHEAAVVIGGIQVQEGVHDVLGHVGGGGVVAAGARIDGVRFALAALDGADDAVFFLDAGLVRHVVHQLEAGRHGVQVLPGDVRIERDLRLVRDHTGAGHVPGRRREAAFRHDHDAARIAPVVNGIYVFNGIAGAGHPEGIHDGVHVLRQQVVPHAVVVLLDGALLQGFVIQRHAAQVAGLAAGGRIVQDGPAVVHVVVAAQVNGAGIEVHALAQRNAVARAGEGRHRAVVPQVLTVIHVLIQEHLLVGMHLALGIGFGIVYALVVRFVEQLQIDAVVVAELGGRGAALGKELLHLGHDPVRSLERDARIGGQLDGRLVGAHAGAVAGDHMALGIFKGNVLHAAGHIVNAHQMPARFLRRLAGVGRRVDGGLVVVFHPQLDPGLFQRVVRHVAEGHVGAEPVAGVLDAAVREHFRRLQEDPVKLIIVPRQLPVPALAVDVLEEVPPVGGVHGIVPVQEMVGILDPFLAVPRAVIRFAERALVLLLVHALPADRVGQRARREHIAVAHGEHLVIHGHVMAVPQPVQRHLIGMPLGMGPRIRGIQGMRMPLRGFDVFVRQEAARGIEPLHAGKLVRIPAGRSAHFRHVRAFPVLHLGIALRQREMVHVLELIRGHVLEAGAGISRPQIQGAAAVPGIGALRHIIVFIAVAVVIDIAAARGLLVPQLRDHVAAAVHFGQEDALHLFFVDVAAGLGGHHAVAPGLRVRHGQVVILVAAQVRIGAPADVHIVAGAGPLGHQGLDVGGHAAVLVQKFVKLRVFGRAGDPLSRIDLGRQGIGFLPDGVPLAGQRVHVHHQVLGAQLVHDPRRVDIEYGAFKGMAAGGGDLLAVDQHIVVHRVPVLILFGGLLIIPVRRRAGLDADGHVQLAEARIQRGARFSAGVPRMPDLLGHLDAKGAGRVVARFRLAGQRHLQRELHGQIRPAAGRQPKIVRIPVVPGIRRVPYDLDAFDLVAVRLVVRGFPAFPLALAAFAGVRQGTAQRQQQHSREAQQTHQQSILFHRFFVLSIRIVYRHGPRPAGLFNQ